MVRRFDTLVNRTPAPLDSLSLGPVIELTPFVFGE
jgi:hypothetical protein